MIKPAGVILAGGLSTRMGGEEKSLLKIGNKTLLELVKTRLSPQVSSMTINANGDPERFAAFGLDVVADTLEGFQGPLAGVLAGMRWATKNTASRKIVTIAADTPFFPENLVSSMTQAGKANKIVLAGSNGRRHPVFGLWDVSLADELETFLKGGDRKVMLFVQRYPNETVEFPVHQHDPFFNVNTPDELAIAERLQSEQAV